MSPRTLRFPAVLATLAVAPPACQGTFAASVVQSSSPHASDEEAGWLVLGVGAGLLAVSATTAVVSEGAMSAYLDRHCDDVELALARGSGPFVSDVADRLGAGEADLAAIGEALRAARPVLHERLRAAGPGRDRDFWLAVHDALLASPATAPLVARRVAELGAAR